MITGPWNPWPAVRVLAPYVAFALVALATLLGAALRAGGVL